MVFDKIREILASQFDVDEDEITTETNLIDEFGADSLDVVEVMTSIENEFNIVITDESVHDVKTVSDIVDIVSGYVS
mgnify:CR=1 FL=1